MEVLWWRQRRGVARQRADRAQDVAAGPYLAVRTVGIAQGPREVALPGDVRAYQQTALYAKISGYLKVITVERGDRVKPGQILGILEAPDYINEVTSARSESELKMRTAERARNLVAEGIISQQERDNADTEKKVADANLLRLSALRGYDTIRAPFDGVITARYADQGSLLPAATGSTQSALSFTSVKTLRRFCAWETPWFFGKTKRPTSASKPRSPAAAMPSTRKPGPCFAKS